jgi:uncharacterized OB-fold protein
MPASFWNVYNMSDTSQASPADPYAAAFPETRPFWDSAAAGKFVLPRCNACGKTHWHPRAFCPLCFSPDISWTPASGGGEVYSFTIVRRKDSPYVLAYVKLAEGPVMMTNVIGCEPESVRIGLPVQVCFRPAAEGRHMPVFKPA